MRAELPGGGELLFCAHHGRKHADELARIALNIHDETDRLADTPDTAPNEEI